MKRCGLVLVLAYVITRAFLVSTVSAQTPRDPLIDPPSGGAGSRFQIVGQSGWQPGESITLSIYFTVSADPFAAASGDFRDSQTARVLSDGTWSFPLVVNEYFQGAPPPGPGYIVVRAQAASHTAVNAYVYAPNGVNPAGFSAVLAASGFGPLGPAAGVANIVALFGAGLGALLLVSGAWRTISPAT